jgi:hypothetical protein
MLLPSKEKKMIIYMTKSTRRDKKYMVKFESGKTIHFGAAGMSDYTIHKDSDRKDRYISRHSAGGSENWTKSGIETAGFWSRWILWNKTTIADSINDLERRFNIKVGVIF